MENFIAGVLIFLGIACLIFAIVALIKLWSD